MARIRALPAVSVLFASLVLAPAAQADVFFKSPTGNIACQQVNSKQRVECTVLSTASSRGTKVFWVKRSGRTGTYLSKGNAATDVPVLAYGRSKKLLGGAVTCTSRTSGLTCRNRSGHGYTLSKQRQRRF